MKFVSLNAFELDSATGILQPSSFPLAVPQPVALACIGGATELAAFPDFVPYAGPFMCLCPAGMP